MKSRFVIKRTKCGQFYFNLLASNNQIIASSEMYTRKQSCKRGIKSVMQNVGIAEITDTTD